MIDPPCRRSPPIRGCRPNSSALYTAWLLLLELLRASAWHWRCLLIASSLPAIVMCMSSRTHCEESAISCLICRWNVINSAVVTISEITWKTFSNNKRQQTWTCTLKLFAVFACHYANPTQPTPLLLPPPPRHADTHLPSAAACHRCRSQKMDEQEWSFPSSTGEVSLKMRHNTQQCREGLLGAETVCVRKNMIETTVHGEESSNGDGSVKCGEDQ